MKTLTWKIAGEAGFGIMSSGVMLARAFARAGYHVFADNDYPSLIRGGHNVVTVRIGSQPFMAMNRDLHVLVALNSESVERHAHELNTGAAVIYDPHDKEWTTNDFPREVQLMPVPLREIVKSLNADVVMRNTVALGATLALCGADFSHLSSVIHDQFIRKGQEVVDQNVKIAKAGFDCVRENFASQTSFHLGPGGYQEPLAVVNGNEALGLGAVRAGLKFAAIYPMTPINALITFLADHAEALQIVYKQPEDEIAGINMAIGAAVAGARSMVATSGGGFALMNEGVALAGMVEAPVVIDVGMRVGPATGMPTYTEQGELSYIIHCGHGEFPRIVLAPGDAEQAYHLTIAAFQLADKYQTPVFILTDKYLNENQWSLPVSILKQPVGIDRGRLVMGDTGKAEGEFRRYDPTSPDGISARSVPGTKHGLYFANSYEHDAMGHSTDKAEQRRAMVEKRMHKRAAMQSDIIQPVYIGDKNADVTFITWGTTKGPVISAADILISQGKTAAVIAYPWLYPFPVEATRKLLSNAKRVVDVEQNSTGQLASLIRSETGIEIKEKMLKYDGRQFFPEEIIERLGEEVR